VLLLAPAVATAAFIAAYSVNGAFMDHLALTPYFKKLQQGQLSLGDLYAQHNEHRLVFPRLISLALGSVTRFDNVPEMYVGWFLLCVSGAVLWADHRRREGGGEASRWRFLPVPWLLFTWLQYDLLLRGDGIPTYLAVAALLTGLFVLHGLTRPGLALAAALTCGVVASFSYANGLLLWPLGALCLAASPRVRGRDRWVALAAWCTAGMAVIAAYFRGYHQPPHHPSLLHFLREPVDALVFFLTVSGSALAVESRACLAVGAVLLPVLLFLVAVAIRRPGAEPGTPFAVWVALFAVASALALVAGRSGFGAVHALASRYAPFTVLGVIAAYLLALDLSRRGHPAGRPLSGFVLALMSLGVVESVRFGREAGRSAHDHKEWAAYYLSSFRFQPDVLLQRVYPDAGVVRRWGQDLRAMGLNVFAEDRLRLRDLAPSAEPTLSALERFSEGPHDTCTVQGWAVDQPAGALAQGVFLLLDDTHAVPARYGLERPDVAAQLGAERYRYSGFLATFSCGWLGRGRHHVRLKVAAAHGQSYYEPAPILAFER
jgi:hypothetical protein